MARKVVSWSHGRLGNLMFIVASGKYFADKHGMDYYLLRSDSHDNFISTVEKGVLRKIKLIDHIDGTYEKIRENGFFTPIKTTSNNKDIFIDGYRECPRYWDNNKAYCLKLFEPQEGLIDAIKEAYKVNFLDYVCINVRRGDYLKPDVRKRLGLLDIRWFYKCMSFFPKNQKYLIVSDDIPWCKEQFKGDNFLFADKEVKGWNKIDCDLYIQTLCAHNIIANSTFSWWGAYLNTNKNRKVYYPHRFFISIGTKSKIPERDNWIEVPAIWDTLSTTRTNVDPRTVTPNRTSATNHTVVIRRQPSLIKNKILL